MLDKWKCGLYTKPGHYKGEEVSFTLYKCNVNNGSYHWFICITPEGCEPGSTKDTDFYYALAPDGINSVMPPETWYAFPSTQKPQSRAPAPTVRIFNGAGALAAGPMSPPPPAAVHAGPEVAGSGLGHFRSAATITTDHQFLSVFESEAQDAMLQLGVHLSTSALKNLCKRVSSCEGAVQYYFDNVSLFDSHK